MKVKTNHEPVIPPKRVRYSKPAKFLSYTSQNIIPRGIVEVERIPVNCIGCKWDYQLKDGEFRAFRLKYYNLACPAKLKGEHK